MYLQGGIFSKVYYQVLFIIYIYIYIFFSFFLESISFLKKDARHVSLLRQYGPFSLSEAGWKQGRSESVSGPLRILQGAPYKEPRGAGWLLCSHAKPPPEGWEGAQFSEHSFAAGQKRPGEGAQEHEIFMYLGHRASHRKSKTREAHCLKKYMWNLNGVLFRGKKRNLEPVCSPQRIKF